MKFVQTRRTGVLAGLCLLLFVAPSTARPGFRPGVEIGVNLSSLYYPHADESQFPFTYWDRHWRPCITGGLTLDIPIRGTLSLATGLRYVQEGNRVGLDTGPPAPLTGEFRISQNYLAVPMRAAWRPATLKGGFVALGPEVAYLLSGRMAIDYTSDPESNRTENITKDLYRVNVALDAEAGYEMRLGRHEGVVTVRYAHGLTSTAKKDHWISGWQTRGIECLLGARW